MAETLQIVKADYALHLMMKIAKTQRGLSLREEEVLSLLVKSVPLIELEDGGVFRLSDLKGFIQNFQRAVEQKDSSWLMQKRGRRWKVPDIEEFAESPEYMNQRGYLRPVIKYELQRLFGGGEFVEAVLTGAIGIGKNYFADIALAYMICKLSCYHNPQIEYGLAPGSSIVFILQSKTATLAQKVAFEQFAARLKRSPYFQKLFPFDPQVKSELRFPKQINVYPIGGSDTSALGMNVYGGMIDEMNYMERVVDSTYTRHTGEEEYDQAERLYNTLINRMRSRFMQQGRLPGKLLLVSSRSYPGDFTDRKMDEAATDPSIFVMNYAQWEALPADRFCGDKFLVEVGNEYKQSRIVATREDAKDADDVIEVPTEYRPAFERNLDDALRDLGGIAAGTKHPFIPHKELIVKAYETYEATVGEGNQLFLHDEVVIQDILPPEEAYSQDFWRLVNREYLEEMILDKSTVFAAHIDVGLTGDAAGVGIGRITGYRLLPNMRVYNERTKEFVEVSDARAPMYTIDGVLRCIAEPGDEVDLEAIRDLILFLRGHLFVRWATMDSYQSAMMIQAFRKARMRSGVLSVDTSIAPYTEVKLAIKDERILYPNHPVLTTELRTVERDKKKDKIDHPKGGSKDCADSVAGVVYMLMQKEARFGRPARRRTRTRPKSTGVRSVKIGRRRKSRMV